MVCSICKVWHHVKCMGLGKLTQEELEKFNFDTCPWCTAAAEHADLYLRQNEQARRCDMDHATYHLGRVHACAIALVLRYYGPLAALLPGPETSRAANT